MQINSYSYLQNYALDQWTRDLPIRANRGEIYDRNGVILATNQTSYDIYLRPRMVENDEYTAQTLSQVLGKDKAILLQRISKKSTSEFTVALSVPESVMKSVMSYELKGVYYSLSSKRYYPYSELLSQVLGYTTLDGSGLAGIEKYYDDILRGENGKVLTEADLLGMEIKDGKTFILNGVDGLDIELTIDYNVQAIAENA
ncbi:MAG: stage V sporulation protein D, partial [Clostridia bacterium]|nr:stage V sporulation protein D [Clostridia bacterium]